MKNPNIKKRNIKLVIALGALVLLFVVLSLLQLSTEVCEFFARTVSRAWIYVFGNALGWIPISLYEMFLIVVILGAIAFVVVLIVLLCKHKWGKALCSVLIVAISVMSFVNIYSVSASFSYNRKPLPQEIYQEYSTEDLPYEEALQLAEHIVALANEAYNQTEHDENGNIVYPYTLAEMSDLLAQEYSKLQNDYFSSYTPKGKWILNKNIMSELHIVGVFFAPFGEANINGYETNLYLPHTLAHEQAHGKGVMRENEANLMAYYVLLCSDNPYLRYGALVKCASAVINMLTLYPNSQPDYVRLNNMIAPGINAERANYNIFYSKFTLLADIGDFFNDLYLKLHKQSGTDSYVKPPVYDDTDQKDDYGQVVVVVRSFSDVQNIVIKLYKQNKI